MAIDFGASEPKAQAAFALHRFGFGPRPGDIDRIAADPHGALLAELKPGAGKISDSDLAGSGEAFREAFDIPAGAQGRAGNTTLTERRDGAKRHAGKINYKAA